MKHRYVVSTQSLQNLINNATPKHFEVFHIDRKDEEARLEIHAVGENGIINLKHSLSILASETVE